MKLNKILLMGAIALGLVACKNDDLPGNGQIKDGEKAWTSFTISLPSVASSRAVDDKNHGDYYAGTADEQKVGSAYIVLYNTGGTVKYAFDLAAATDGTGAFAGGDVSGVVTPTVNKFTTKAKELEKAEYEVYVFLNAPQAVKDATKPGMLKASLEAAAQFVNTEVMSASGFFMSNAKGAVLTTDDNWKPTEADAEAAATSVKVGVERAVAKVFVNNAAIPAANVQNGTAVVKRFALDVTNRKLFWVRQMDKIVGGTDDEIAASDRMISYAKDPNMAGGYDTKSPSDLDGEFDYRFDGNVIAPGAVDAKAPGYDDNNGIYVAENTMDANQQYEVATTRVVFEINYIPTGLTADASYVEYKGVILAQADFEAKVTAAQAPGATDASVAMPAGFVTEITALTTPLDYNKSFVEGNIKFYKDGVNYYTTTIRHFTNDQEAALMGYGRHGVVRNNIYKLTVNTIKGPGEPVIPQPDPEIPDDKEKTFIAVDVDVQQWLVREQGVDL